MQQEAKNKKTKQSERELLQAELDAFTKNPDEDPVLVISRDNELVKFVKQNKTYKLRHEHAFIELIDELPCDVADIRQYLEFVTEDLTEFALGNIGVPEYQRHRKLLKSLGYYFDTLMNRVEERKS